MSELPLPGLAAFGSAALPPFASLLGPSLGVLASVLIPLPALLLSISAALRPLGADASAAPTATVAVALPDAARLVCAGALVADGALTVAMAEGVVDLLTIGSDNMCGRGTISARDGFLSVSPALLSVVAAKVSDTVIAGLRGAPAAIGAASSGK